MTCRCGREYALVLPFVCPSCGAVVDEDRAGEVARDRAGEERFERERDENASALPAVKPEVQP